MQWPPFCEVFPGKKTNDAKTLIVGPWVDGMLLLMDRGFFKFDVFAKIEDYGGFFCYKIKI